MIKISLKKYMAIDLLMIFIIGTVVEFLSFYIIPRSIPFGVPGFCVSVLLIVVAEARWGYKGLLLVPLYAIVTIVAGRLVGYYKGNYDLTMFLSNLVGFAGTAIVLVFRRNSKDKEMFSDWAKTLGITLLALLIVIVLQSAVYSVIERYNFLNSIGYHFVQNASGIAITIIGILVLYSQKVTRDVYRTLLEKAKEKEYERKYYSQYVNEIVVKPGQGKMTTEKTQKNDTLGSSEKDEQKK